MTLEFSCLLLSLLLISDQSPDVILVDGDLLLGCLSLIIELPLDVLDLVVMVILLLLVFILHPDLESLLLLDCFNESVLEQLLHLLLLRVEVPEVLVLALELGLGSHLVLDVVLKLALQLLLEIRGLFLATEVFLLLDLGFLLLDLELGVELLLLAG